MSKVKLSGRWFHAGSGVMENRDGWRVNGYWVRDPAGEVTHLQVGDPRYLRFWRLTGFNPKRARMAFVESMAADRLKGCGE